MRVISIRGSSTTPVALGHRVAASVRRCRRERPRTIRRAVQQQHQFILRREKLNVLIEHGCLRRRTRGLQPQHGRGGTGLIAYCQHFAPQAGERRTPFAKHLIQSDLPARLPIGGDDRTAFRRRHALQTGEQCHSFAGIRRQLAIPVKQFRQFASLLRRFRALLLGAVDPVNRGGLGWLRPHLFDPTQKVLILA